MKKLDYNNRVQQKQKKPREVILSPETRAALEELKSIDTLEQFAAACEECEIRNKFMWEAKIG